MKLASYSLQINTNTHSHIIVGCGAIAMEITAAFRGGFRGAKGPVLPAKIFYLYVTTTIQSMKMMFIHL